MKNVQLGMCHSQLVFIIILIACNPGSVVQVADLLPVSLGSVPWYPYKSSVAAGRAAGPSCSCAPVKVLPYLGTLVGTSESLNKGVIVVIIGRSDVNCM